MKTKTPFVSIVVPVLNEAALIDPFLRHLETFRPAVEIIIVDGGSADGTRTIARSLADRVVRAERCRAAQMNAGAEIASGDVLWFLHADLQAPVNAIEGIQATLENDRVAGGCFRLRYPRREWIYRVSDSLGNFGVNVFGFALGDHGIFCRRSAFVRAGGYPIVPILEDAELYRRLRAIGHMKQLREEIASDPRTFEKQGRYRTTAVYFLILALYVAGVPITCLNRIYRHFRRRLEVRALAGSGDGFSRDPAKRAGEVQLR
jgi:rSAM/selenodomain-associated transferase 2